MPEATAQRILGVFAKRPLPGMVKTRLAAETSPHFAAQLAEAMLRDTLRRVCSVNARRILAFSPRHEQAAFDEWADGSFELFPQIEGDLGARMADFFAQQLLHAERVVLVGTDSPTLPLEYIERAFEALRRADVVIGPACDGGYYLIGCREFVPSAIFQGVAWGESSVLGQTVDRLPVGCRLELLPTWYDVDTVQDLDVMMSHVRALLRAGVPLELPRLGALLNQRVEPIRSPH
jgi:uncharacterized protein